MFTLFLFFLTGFIALWKGADFFVKGSSNISLIFRIPSIIIGLTIVAFGTSLPELVVNAIASYNHESDLVLGNVLGSNIANIGLILGLVGILSALNFPYKTVRFELPICLGSVVLLMGSYLWISDKMLTRWEAIAFIVIFGIVYYFSIKRNLATEEKEPVKEPTQTAFFAILWILIGLAGIVGGGKIVIDNSIALAAMLGVSKSLIGLFGIALGTSLPELITGISAYRQKNVDLIVGNIIGSNIFNTLLVIGVSGTISNIEIPSNWIIDMSVCAAFTFTLILIVLWRKNTLPRWGSALLLFGYVGYISFIFYRG